MGLEVAFIRLSPSDFAQASLAPSGIAVRPIRDGSLREEAGSTSLWRGIEEQLIEYSAEEKVAKVLETSQRSMTALK
jgi:hypothetical protein